MAGADSLTRRSPLRVALLATVVEFGGIESVLTALLQHMDSDIQLFPILFTRTDIKEQRFFECLHALGVGHQTMYVDLSRAKYMNPVRNLIETTRFLRRHRFDLIHSHGYRANIIGLAASKWCGIPALATCHGFISTDRHLRVYRRLDILVLRYFAGVIAVSARMKDELVAGGVPARRIEVVPNAVAVRTTADYLPLRRAARAKLGILNGDFVFGYVGRLSEEKGLTNVIQALQRLSTTRPQTRVLLVGEGPQRTALERTVRDMGLVDRVHFLGFQNDTAAWYPAMDAFVLPSLTEGTPMALLEAMANRLPVIGTMVGGVPAVVSNGANGLLVPPADPDALAEAMALVATDADLRVQLAEAGLRTVRERYDVATWIAKVRDVYEAAASCSRHIA